VTPVTIRTNKTNLSWKYLRTLVIAPDKEPDGALGERSRNSYFDHLHHSFQTSPMRTKITVLCALVAGGNFVAWSWAFIALHDYPDCQAQLSSAIHSGFDTPSMLTTLPQSIMSLGS
jgi:hypothetical protein